LNPSDRLQAGPAQVADHAGGVGRSRQHADGGVAGLFLARQHAGGEAGLGLDLLDEGRPVPGLAHGGGGGDEGLGRLDGFQHGPEALERRQGLGDALGVQPAAVAEVTAQPGQDLLVEDRPDGATFQPVHHEADRV